MVGSVDFNNKEIDGQVNVANRLRQPGSSIKPINYVTALEMGWTLATPVLDAEIEFPDDEGPYVPVNYDEKFHGQVSLRTALANSYNIPAIKTLFYVGVPRMIASAQRFGITTFGDPERYGLSLTLGGGDVKLVELTGAYAVFANGGYRAPVTPFTTIIDGEGNVLFDAEAEVADALRVIDPRHAYLITNVLSDNKARAPAFGQNSPLKLCLDGTSTCPEDQVRPVAAKTGTTNDFRDNWTLGYTPEVVVGVWVGNPRNEQMNNVSGISGAAPIWHNIMARMYAEIEPYKSTPPHPFPVPAGLVEATVCASSGILATQNCEHKYNEIFLAEQTPGERNNPGILVRVDRTNGLLAGDACPPEIVEIRHYSQIPGDIRLVTGKVEDWIKSHRRDLPPQEWSTCGAQVGPPPDSAPTGPEQGGGGQN
jgi:membrane peptidoglycan carboxypeptidase